jgi:CRP-like cAMP-binding protein
MSIDDYYKTVGYACIYKGLGTTVDAVPAEELTVSLFRETYPREMMEALKRLGACIEETFPGIYYVHGNTLFDTQIVVTGQLSRETHSSLRVLSKNAQEDDIKRFLMTSQELTTPGDKHNADAVLQVSISANGRIYNRVKEELNMCEALRELMKDEIAYDVEQGIAKGMVEGEKKQAMTTAYTLSDMGMTIDVIAKAIHYSVETVTQWLENRPADTAQG